MRDWNPVLAIGVILPVLGIIAYIVGVSVGYLIGQAKKRWLVERNNAWRLR